MSVSMVRFKVKADRTADVEASIQRVFAAIEKAQPHSVRYAACKLADGVTFVAILELEHAGDNPLAAMPAFQQFQAEVKDLIEAAATIPEQMDVVGSYRLFGHIG